MAQFGSVLEWGSRGRRFESSHPDSPEASDIKASGIFLSSESPGIIDVSLPFSGEMVGDAQFTKEGMPMLYFAERISEHIRKREPEGYLICTGVPIERYGTQQYMKDELGQGGGFLPRREGDRRAE